jgi:hypothetical protein
MKSCLPGANLSVESKRTMYTEAIQRFVEQEEDESNRVMCISAIKDLHQMKSCLPGANLSVDLTYNLKEVLDG